MKTPFIKNITPIQQKGRKIPINLQERAERNLNILIDQKHIIKLDKCSDTQFISPLIITVKGSNSKTSKGLERDNLIYSQKQLLNAKFRTTA